MVFGPHSSGCSLRAWGPQMSRIQYSQTLVPVERSRNRKPADNKAALYVYGLLNISFPYCPTPSIFPHKILSPVFVTWVMLVKQHTYYYHCPLSWTLISWCGSFEDWIGTQVLKIMPTNSLSVNNPTAKSEPERVIMGFQRCNIHPTQAPGKILCSIH